MADGLHEVRFAEAGATVYEQRVILRRRCTRNRHRRGMGELIVGPITKFSRCSAD